VTVSDVNGCTATATAVVSQPSAVAATTTVVNATCGSSNGSATVTATGGTAPYTYAWNTAPVQTTATATGLAAGTYTVTVTDANGCTKTATAIIQQLGSPSVTTTATPVSCFGGNNGTATATVTGGTAPYTYTWSTVPTQTTATATGLIAGTYTVTVSDVNGCTATATAVVSQPSAVAATTTVVNATCGSSNGSATVTATGGTPGYTYLWSNAQTTATATGLAAGTYTVTVTDANGCTKTATATIQQIGSPIVTTNGTNVLCNGGATGTATANVTGGATPYTYLWSNTQTTQTITGLTAGTYTVTATDANGCSGTATRVVTEPATLAGTTTVVDAVCSQPTGSVNLTVSGGTMPYSFLWNSGQTTEDLTNVPAAIYVVTVTDANGCTIVRTAIVGNNASACSIDIEKFVNNQDADNAPGVIILVPNTPPNVTFTYVVTNTGTLTLTNVVVTDDQIPSLNCTIPSLAPGASHTCTITAPAVLGQYTNIGTVTGQPVTPNNTPVGPPVTDNDPANYTGVFINMDKMADKTEVCPGEPVTYTLITRMLGGAPGVQIRNVIAMDNNVTGNLVCNGQYWVTCPQNGGVLCDLNGNCILDFTDPDGNGVTNEEFKWSYTLNLTQTTTNTANDMGEVWYVDPVTGVETFIGNVGNSDQVTVTVNQVPQLSTSVSNGNCQGNTGSINLAVTGSNAPFTYLWNDGVTTEDRNNLAPGTYTVTVTSAKGCTSVTSATITGCDHGDLPDLTAGTGAGDYQTTNANNGPSHGIDPNLRIGATTDAEPNGQPNITATGDGSDEDGVTFPGTFVPNTSANITVNVTNNTGASATVYVFIDWNGDGDFNDPNEQTSVNVPNGTNGPITVSVNVPSAVAAGQGIGARFRLSTDPAAAQPTGNALDGEVEDYIITVGCPTITVSVPAQVICQGQTATLTASASGGIAPYTYAWGAPINASGASQNVTPSATTTYTVTATDANGCTQTATVTVTVNPNPTVAGMVTPATCGLNNGAINITVTGGTTPYTYNWGSGVTTEDRTNLSAGTYTVTVTTANGCTTTGSFTVTQAGTPSVTASSTPVICNGGNTGSATATATGGTTPYAYLWSNAQTTATATNLTAGVYTVTVTDANGCTTSTSVIVSQPSAILAPIMTVNATCGASNGSATVNATGGTTPYAYLWSNTQTTATATGLAAGVYTVTVTDANNCTKTATATVNQLGGPTVTATPIATTCGLNNGSINITATGGTTPYSYNWGSGVTTEDRSNLAAGTYTVTVTDANGCTATASATVAPSTAPTVTAVPTPTTCGLNNGAINITATLGTSPYTYDWADLAGNNNVEDRSNLAPGTYTVTVTDAAGCTTSTSAVVAPSVAPPSVTATSTNATCGQPNGTITLTVTGGATPYTYLWNGGQTTQNRTGLTAGTYCVTVTGNNGCTTSTCVNIVNVAGPTVSVTTTNAICGINNGSATAIATGGATPYTYAWNFNNQAGPSLANLGAGTYCVTVTDANNCTATACGTVTSSSSPSVTVMITNATGNLNNGIINITVTGGTPTYTYDWGDLPGTNNPEDRSGLGAGTYCVTVTDANGCTTAICATINQNGLPSLTSVVGNVSCNGGSNGNINITVVGGTTPYTYQWDDGANTEDRTGLSAGVYCLTVTDAAGFTATTCVTVTEPDPLVITGFVYDSECYGQNLGVIDLEVAGGTMPYTYNWGDPNMPGTNDPQDRFGLAPGTYCVTVTDAKGCTTSECFTVSEAPQIFASGVTTPAGCSNNAGTIDQTVSGGSGGFTYNWSDLNNGNNDPQDRTGLAAGTYTVTIADGNACTVVRTYVITGGGGNAPSAVAQGTNATCGQSNGSINVTVTGGQTPYTFAWSDAPGLNVEDRTGLAAGTYTVTVTGANGCSTTASATIISSGNISVTGQVTNTTCGQNNGAISLTPSNGVAPYSYNWNPGVGGATRTNLSAGTYAVTVTDANGCTTVASFVVAPSNAPTASATATAAGCGLSNGTATVQVAGGTAPYTYVWNTAPTQNSATATGLAAGVYTVTVSDANGCTATASATVTSTGGPSVTGQVTNTTCGLNNGAIALSVSNGTAPYTYTWNPGTGGATRTNLAPGAYAVTVTDANGCSAVASFVVAPSSAPSVTAATTNVTCFGGSNGSITLNVAGGTSPYTYNWNPGTGGALRTNLTAGTYAVTVTDANGCTTSTSVILSQPAAIVATPSTTNATCGQSNGTVTISPTGGTAPYTFVWSNGQTTQNLTGLAAGQYCVTITDVNGCTGTACAMVMATGNVTLTTNVTNSTCGEPNGTILLTATGGSAPYNYDWDFIPGTNDPNNVGNLSAGVYCVTVTDATGCTTSTCITITTTTPPTANATATNTTCGLNNGTATVVAVPGATYLWNNGQTTTTISNLAAGTYCVTVTANGCEKGTCVTVGASSAPTLTTQVTNIGCNGSTGSVTVNVANGNAPYSYLWASGQTTSSISNLNAGTYCVTVTDASGCTATTCATVSQVAPPTITATVNQITCGNANDGSIILNVTNGTAPFTYNWGDIAGNDDPKDRFNLSPNTYCVTVTDATGCTATACYTLTAPSLLTANLVITNATCGNNDGTIDLTVVGGNAPYTYNWDDLLGTNDPEDRTGMAPGFYTVTVTDANGCTAIAFGPVTQPASPSVVVTSQVNPTCTNPSGGSINITVTGGTGGYTYQWSNNATTEDLSGLTAGTYCVTVTASNGCTTSTCVTLTNPGGVTVSAVGTNVTCAGANNGTIAVTATGGANLTYDWSDLPGTNDPEDRTGLNAGTYTVTVTNSTTGCTATASVTITAPTAISITSGFTNPTCGLNNGTISLAVTGGNAPYTYTWSPAGPNAPTRTNLGTGTYNVTVTDASGCTAVTSVTLTAPAPLAVSTVAVNPTCQSPASGTLNAYVIGGTAPYTFDWSNLPGAPNPQNQTGLTGGTYTVTVTDANGCTATASAVMITPNAPTVSASTTNPTCTSPNAGAINLTVTGGTAPLTYNWADISTGTEPEDRTGLAAGTYNVTITDAAGCTTSTSVTLVVPNAPQLTASQTNVVCNGAATGAIDLTVTGGSQPLTYNWFHVPGSNDPQDQSGLAAGTYSVTVFDAVGCSASQTFVITQPTAFVVATTATNVTCFGLTNGAINVDVSGSNGNYTYNWADLAGTNDPEDRSNLAAGTYNLTITDGAGCTTSTSVVVTQPNALAVSTVVINTLCGQNNGTINVYGIGGTAPYKFDWADIAGQDNNPVRNNLAAGTYTVTIIDANGCTSSATATVAVQSTMTTAVVLIQTSCTDNTGSINLTVTGGIAPLTYDWADVPGTSNTEDRSGLAAGFYSVTITDAIGCTTVTSATITTPAPTVNTIVTNTTCGAFDGEIDLVVTGGTPNYTYDWSYDGEEAVDNDPQDLFGLVAGLYIVTVTDAAGCTVVTNAVVTQPNGPTVNCTSMTMVSCFGGSDGAIEITCVGGQAPYTYDWSDNGPQVIDIDPKDRTNLPAGTYSLTVTDATGCQVVIAVVITQPNLLVAAATATNVSCGAIGDGTIDLTATGGTLPYTYDWSHLAGTDNPEDPTGLTAGTYTVTVTDANGCTTVTSASVANPPVGISIGDYVWLDVDQNGFQAATESGYPGITVKLIKAGPDGAYGTNDDIIVATDVTDAAGKYEFGCVTPGTYSIMFGNLPTGYEWTAPNAVNNDCLDSDVNAAGMTPPFTVTTSTVSNFCFDAGLHPACDNIQFPGLIGNDQVICEGQTPALLTEVAPPTGGSGAFEYLWMQLIVDQTGTPTWVGIPGANGPTYQPGPLTQTSYFMRCTRRAGCTQFLETNVITIRVLPAGEGDCEGFNPEFTANKQDDGVMLDWSTLPEIDQYLYTVQFSTDQNFWMNLVAMTGHADASAPNLYNYMHGAPVCGINYYRIMRTDSRGNETYSTVRSVSIDGDGVQSMMVYPNPTKDGVNLLKVGNCGITEDAIVTIFAANGDEIRSVIVRSNATQMTQLDMSDLPAAVYMARVMYGDGRIQTIRIVKL
jgi:hypothetical protein